LGTQRSMEIDDKGKSWNRLPEPCCYQHKPAE
jgi:hypothetical protein